MPRLGTLAAAAPLLAAQLATTSALDIMVPAYFYAQVDAEGKCSTKAFHDMAAAGDVVTAIVNPNNGPIDDSDPHFAAASACYQLGADAGNKMVGYIHTKFAEQDPPNSGIWKQTGLRDMAEIKADIDLYIAKYPMVSGIFVDEVTANWAPAFETKPWAPGRKAFHEEFYATIFAYVRRANPSYSLAINPGNAFPMSYLTGPNAPDSAVLFEGGYATKWDPRVVGVTCKEKLWTQAKEPFDEGPWCPYVRDWDGVDALKAAAAAGTYPTKMVALIYGTDVDGTGAAPYLNAIVAQAAAGNVATLYVTDQPIWAPWSDLTTYWSNLVRAVRGQLPTTTATTTTTTTTTTPTSTTTLEDDGGDDDDIGGEQCTTISPAMRALLAGRGFRVVTCGER